MPFDAAGWPTEPRRPEPPRAVRSPLSVWFELVGSWFAFVVGLVLAAFLL